MSSDSFDQLRNETITLVKQTGEQVPNIRASMGKGNKIINFGAKDVEVDDGDTIIRHLPNDRTEEYVVLDSGFSSGGLGIPASYDCKVEKKTALPRSSIQRGTTYNVTFAGANSRFNLHSFDLSTNLVDVGSDQLFEELRKAIAREVEDEAKRQKMLEQVSELEKTSDTSQFLEVYQRFIALAADHMTVIMPFIPALTQMLGV